VSCSSLSLAAGERLAGTASIARRWLLVEVRGAWGRDAVADSELDAAARQRLEGWLAEEDGSRVLFVRRPDRRGDTTTVFTARTDEDGGELRRLTLPSLRALADADLEAGERIDRPLLLVCTHGRRDPCCARQGRPVFEALDRHVAAGDLWQSSHQGGHRFAANVLALPAGISLGRVPAEAAATVAATLTASRIPLEYFRGRTIHPPEAQAAEAAVRERFGLTAVRDVRFNALAPGRVLFASPDGPIEVGVTAGVGPRRPESCGADPVPAPVYEVRF
jgi:hypothetical protein